jgi:hypothetical protein
MAETTGSFNEEDLIGQAIADDLPEDQQGVREQHGLFGFSGLFGWIVLIIGGAWGLYVAFSGAGFRWTGLWIALGAVLWGAAAISVGRDGRRACSDALQGPVEGEGPVH